MSPRGCRDVAARSGGRAAPGGVGVPSQAATSRRDAARVVAPQDAIVVRPATWLAAALAALLGAVATAAPAADGTYGHPPDSHAHAAPAADAESTAPPGPDAGPDDKGMGFAVPRRVIAGGGGASSGGVFAIAGTIGQVDTDPLHPATGGAFAIGGGFWPGVAPAAPWPDPVFASSFEPATP